MKFKNLFLVLSLFVSLNVSALQVFEGKVLVLEPTQMPNAIYFTLSTGDSVCPSGGWLIWQNPDVNNNKTLYASLLAAMISNKTVRFHRHDANTTCTGAYLHILN